MKTQFWLACLFLFSVSGLQAQLNPQAISIPMRDGKALSAQLYLPNATGTFPVILIQTPYNKLYYQLTGLPLGVDYDIASSNYAFVVLDWRCFYGSIGACTANPNRGEDGYDAVEWIAAQPWCNGKVGTWGPSALGNVQFQTAYEQPPHLVCAIPKVAAPWETYHKYYPGGSIIVEHLQTLQTLFGNYDLVIDNPYYNLIWQFAENTSMNPELVDVPMLLVAGWFDHNTEWDMVLIDTLSKASPQSVRDKHKILVGPWVHGGTSQSSVGTGQQGELFFPEAAAWNDIKGLEFFDFYMRGVENGWEDQARYIYFQMGDNEWHESQIWPPAGGTSQTYYLHADGTILPEAPDTPNASLSFPYDPEDPSPTIGGKTLNPDLLQGPYDQAEEVESRADVLLFSTPVLTESISIQGKIGVQLYVSSDRPDTDFTLRLTDVYPDGRSILLGECIQRMRFRNGYTQAAEAFMNPGEVYLITLEFEDLAVTFPVGHQLRLIVSSSNYPRYNRNMNTGGEMHPNGNIDTLVNPLVATNSVHLNTAYPSSLELPLAAVSSGITNPDNLKLNIDISPNPTTGQVEVRGEGIIKVELYDINGQLIRRVSTANSLDLEGLPAGVYVVQVVTEKGVVSRQVVKH
ncbi:MAG: CocE/NonD family hydrolase [Saprospirales bacterium]|nr:CocE/NonD family hydrolase [Saprospirales bacterium]